MDVSGHILDISDMIWRVFSRIVSPCFPYGGSNQRLSNETTYEPPPSSQSPTRAAPSTADSPVMSPYSP